MKNHPKRKEKKTDTTPGKLLVVIGGPTASGKTKLAIETALRFHTEIISADSRQFFRELSIGTAKPGAEELARVKHHFIDSHSVSETFNAGRFGTEARELLAGLFAAHDVVVMAGGSGLYIDAVLFGIDDLPASDAAVRKSLKLQLQQQGLAALQEKLRELDPGIIATIDINNPQRVIRAIEVTLASGKPYSTQLGAKNDPLPWNWMMAGIDLPRAELYSKIDERTREMIRSGFTDEARSVLPYRHKNALQTVGYREMFEYLDGMASLEETAEKISRHTRNYAKRQMTWFRRYKDMVWIRPGEEDRLFQVISDKLSGITTE